MADELREIKHCRYINDDDGNDTAWCVQNWAKCPHEENQAECPLFAEDSFISPNRN